MYRGKIIYLIGRDNWQKDDSLNHILYRYLRKTGYKIVWEDPAGQMLYKLRQFENAIKILPGFLRKFNLRCCQILYGLFHWSYFSFLSDRKNEAISLRARKLKMDIQALEPGSDIILLSRSSGGRIASLIADEVDIRYLICLGYPFKHPEREPEPDRFQHLATIKTPMLIIQGDQDEYGGLDVPDKYPLSPAVEIMFVEAFHDFILTEKEWGKVLAKITTILRATP